jgi:hypothetical protein
VLEFTEVDDGDPTTFIAYISGNDYLKILGGTGRFATARSAGGDYDLVTTFWTPDPVDLTDLSDPRLTAIPALYFQEGVMDLGRRRR